MHSHGLKYQYITTSLHLHLRALWLCIQWTTWASPPGKLPWTNMMTLLITYWAISILHKLSHLILWYSEYTLYPLLYHLSNSSDWNLTSIPFHFWFLQSLLRIMQWPPSFWHLKSGGHPWSLLLTTTTSPTLNAAKSTSEHFLYHSIAFYLPFTPLLKPPSPLP